MAVHMGHSQYRTQNASGEQWINQECSYYHVWSKNGDCSKAARPNVCWSWAGVAQQACRRRLSRDDGGRKQFWVRRSAQQFQCSMAVLELVSCWNFVA